MSVHTKSEADTEHLELPFGVSEEETKPEKAEGSAYAFYEGEESDENLSIPTDLSFFEQHAAAGSEDLEPGDLPTPYLAIVQSQSSINKKGEEGYNPDAEEGDIYRTDNHQIVAKGEVGVWVTPIFALKRWVVRTSKKAGRKYRGMVSSRECLEPMESDGAGKYVRENGEIVSPAVIFGVLVHGAEGLGGSALALISMESMQLKKARKWLGALNTKFLPREGGGEFRAPYFAYRYQISTGKEHKDQDSWYGWRIPGQGKLNDPKSDAAALAAGIFEERHNVVPDGLLSLTTEG